MQLDLALLTIGGLVLVLGLLSGLLRRSFVSEPLLALGVGVLLGPRATGLLDMGTWGDADLVLKEATRLTLAISLMAVALRLPPRLLSPHRAAIAGLLGLVMPAMWVASSALVLFALGVPVALAALIGAILTPTDPVVATSIVTGKLAERTLPDRIRHTLSAESGANDGLALPLVAFGVIWMSGDLAGSWGRWLLERVVWEVGGAVLFGAVAGFAAGRVLEWALAREEIETTSRLAYTLALTLATLGGASLLHLNEVLAVFITGLAFDRAVRDRDRREEEAIQEAINRFFLLPIFVLLGLALPWQAWAELGWRGPALALAILALRRLPLVWLLRPALGSVGGRRDALFLGWFGPIGVAALYYALYAAERTGATEPWTIATLVVAVSVIAHGVTATPLTHLYGRAAARHREAPGSPPGR
jgi:sodium/hydrogen antiporter